jgi:UDP-N-acetyl-2-amino-2-deoxyglucuronate dehydrogenase
VTVHSDIEPVLNNVRISIVSICSRPDFHAAQAIQVAKAGKHIILEKPIGLSLQDCLELEGIIQNAGVKVYVCFECRFSDQFVKTKYLLDHDIGDVTYCSVSYCHGIGPDNPQFPWNTKIAMGGSSLLSAGCHALDGVLFFMGGEVEEVYSYSSTISASQYQAYEYAPHQITLLKFTDGRMGHTLSSIACTQPYDFPTYIIGTGGTIKDDLYFSAGMSEKVWQSAEMKLLKSGKTQDHPYRKKFATFMEAIKASVDMPRTNFAEALKTHRVLFAADLSAKQGRPIRLSELDARLFRV